MQSTPIPIVPLPPAVVAATPALAQVVAPASITAGPLNPAMPEDPFGSAPFSLPPGLREKASALRKTGGKA